METPKDPNEVLRHPKDPYRRNRVLRLNGPDGVERQYLLVQELGPGRAILRDQDGTEVVAVATQQGIATMSPETAAGMPASGEEMARREYREVEKPLFKRIRKAHGRLNGFQVANEAMDNARAMLNAKVSREGGWRPGMQTEVAQRIAHAYLHELGKEPCDCPPQGESSMTEQDAGRTMGSTYGTLLNDLTTINDALQLEAVDDEEEEEANELMRRLIAMLAINDQDKAKLAQELELAD